MRPFRFGIVAAQAASGAEWKDLARRAEGLGYSSLLMPDGAGPILSPFSALATAAAVTSTLRVGNWVLANDLRNPVLLAREAATLDLLSDGRLDLGLGAGRGDSDYAALGLGEVPPPGVRLKRLDESLQLLQRLFTGEPVTFTGEHYSVNNATLFPVPKRKSIPILMAASGPRALALAAKRADIVAIAGGSADMYRQQVERVRSAAGGRFEDIELASIVWLAPDDNPAARQMTETMLKRLAGVDLETMIASKTPTVLVGSHAAMIEQLQAARETLGLSYVIVNGQAAPWFAPVVERLAGSS